MRIIHTKRIVVSLCFGAALVILSVTGGGAVEIVPATIQDILGAMGPDAKGLALSQESLPDLFALTASRIEENPKQFIVTPAYTSGRWMGGKAVIEYARDLSYTLVSVYDKEGNRQRIYSVRTKFTEHVARQEEKTYSQDVPEQRTVTPQRSQVVRQAEPVYEPREASPPPPPPPSQPVRSVAPVASSAKEGGSNVRYEWDDAQATYVPVATSGESSPPESTPVSEAAKETPKAAEEREPSPSTRRKNRRRHQQEETAVASARPSRRSSSHASSVSAESSKPGTPSANGVWMPVAPKPPTPAATEVRVANTTWVEKKVVASSKMSEPKEKEWVPKGIDSSDRTEVPSEEELITGSAPQAASEVKRAPVPAPPPARVNSVPAPEAVPSTEELLATSDSQAGADTSEGDKWVPKATPKSAVVEPEMPQETTKVASIPKRSAPVDNSVDNLLRMAEQGKGGMPRESDAWVPAKTAAPKPDADLNKELARIRHEEKTRAVAKPVEKVRRDVNNPEEGVLPVSTFEKISGPLYGRHREYERRFYPGKKPRAKAPDHDFYVEEIDRKKEIHNVYFYKHLKGKAPKLVAVDRHERVSFKSNYDIDKEDKGKLSTYN